LPALSEGGLDVFSPSLVNYCNIDDLLAGFSSCHDDRWNKDDTAYIPGLPGGSLYAKRVVGFPFSYS
jgi:hypothetical protein